MPHKKSSKVGHLWNTKRSSGVVPGEGRWGCGRAVVMNTFLQQRGASLPSQWCLLGEMLSCSAGCWSQGCFSPRWARGRIRPLLLGQVRCSSPRANFFPLSSSAPRQGDEAERAERGPLRHL